MKVTGKKTTTATITGISKRCFPTVLSEFLTDKIITEKKQHFTSVWTEHCACNHKHLPLQEKCADVQVDCPERLQQMSES